MVFVKIIYSQYFPLLMLSCIQEMVAVSLCYVKHGKTGNLGLCKEYESIKKQRCSFYE